MKDTFDREHHIEAVVCKRQFAGIALDEFDSIAGTRYDLGAGALQLARVQIQTGQLHPGVMLIDMRDRAAEAAADVQYA